jgi:WD40 repeat protein
VWRDTADLWPGQDWRAKIRQAITEDALVFIACFSLNSVDRSKSYQNEELLLAVDQLRLRRPEDPWLIPVRFDECDIPDRDIGGGRTLASIQRSDLFGDRFNEGVARLIVTIRRILEPKVGVGPATPMSLHADGCVLGYHDEAVSSIALRHDDHGVIAYSAGWDNCVRAWQLEQRSGLGEFARADTAIRSIALTRLGTTDVLVAAGDNGTIRGWDASTGAIVVEPFQAHQGLVYSVAAAVVAGRTLVVSSGGDRKTYSWDLSSSKMASVISDNPAEEVGPTEIVILNDRPTLLFGGTNYQEHCGFASAYDIILGREVRKINRADNGPVWAVDAAYRRGTELMVTAGRNAVVCSWDLASGDQHSRTEGWPILGVHAVKIVSFGSRLIAISGGGEDDGMIRLTDLDTGSLLYQLIGAHRARVLCLAVADVHGVLCVISGSVDRAVRMQPLWRTANH